MTSKDGNSVDERVLVVVPTYNEKDNIGRLIPQVLSCHPRIEVLVIDDNSPDGTAQVVESLGHSTARVHLVRRECKLGLGSAYLAGFRFAIEQRYAFVLEMDADLSHAPAAVPRFLEAARSSDLVIGSRYITGGETPDWPRRRRLLSRAANLYTRLLTGMPLTDATSGYRCFRREVLENITTGRIACRGYGFQIEMAFRAWKMGYRVSEIPIVFADRTEGQSKLSGGIVWEALWTLWKLRMLSITGRL